MRENRKSRANWHSCCDKGATLAPTGTIIPPKKDGFSSYHPHFCKFGGVNLFIYILTTSTLTSSWIGLGIRLQIAKKCVISLKMTDIAKYLLLKAKLHRQTHKDG